MTDDINPHNLEEQPDKGITKEELNNSSLNKMENVNMSALPIDAVTALEGFLCDFIIASIKAEADGKLTVTDAPLFLPVLLEIPGLLPKLKDVPAQLGDIDPAEAVTIQNTMNDKFEGVLSPQVDAIADAALQTVLSFNNLYQAIKASKVVAPK